jgi:hypothetical protein
MEGTGMLFVMGISAGCNKTCFDLLHLSWLANISSLANVLHTLLVLPWSISVTFYNVLFHSVKYWLRVEQGVGGGGAGVFVGRNILFFSDKSRLSNTHRWVPKAYLFVRQQSYHVVTLTTALHLVLTLRTREALSPLPVHFNVAVLN